MKRKSRVQKAKILNMNDSNFFSISQIMNNMHYQAPTPSNVSLPSLQSTNLSFSQEDNTTFEEEEEETSENFRESDIDKELFLEALRQYKCLWDTNDPSFKERNKKINAWKQLSQAFKTDGEFLLVICMFSAEGLLKFF